jgi:hypothetical protein
LRITDEGINVFAQPVVRMHHKGRTSTQNPFGNSLTLLLKPL